MQHVRSFNQYDITLQGYAPRTFAPLQNIGAPTCNNNQPKSSMRAMSMTRRAVEHCVPPCCLSPVLSCVLPHSLSKRVQLLSKCPNEQLHAAHSSLLDDKVKCSTLTRLAGLVLQLSHLLLNLLARELHTCSDPLFVSSEVEPWVEDLTCSPARTLLQSRAHNSTNQIQTVVS